MTIANVWHLIIYEYELQKDLLRNDLISGTNLLPYFCLLVLSFSIQMEFPKVKGIEVNFQEGFFLMNEHHPFFSVTVISSHVAHSSKVF